MDDYREFKKTGQELVLSQLLKLAGIAETGGHAKIMINNGEVLLNGAADYRKRAQLKAGDLVEAGGIKIRVV